jgi:sugar phosphate isomerase/epimerase
MRDRRTSRRWFIESGLAVAGGLVAVGGIGGPVRGEPAEPNRAASEQPKPKRPGTIRLGAPVFDAPSDPEKLALAHRKLGYRAAYCPGVSLNDSPRIRDIEKAFAKHDVVIAEVGRWINLLDSDAAKRNANMKSVVEGLALADAVGARCCVAIGGSYNTKVWFGPHPDNFSPHGFDAVVENARKIIDEVKPRRAKFAYEVMGWAIPDSPDTYVRLIKAIDRPAFGVHLDPCNSVNSPEKFYGNTALLNEWFDKLGPWIACCHAKDLTWDVEMNVHFREVVLGAGSLDYRTYLKRLAALPNDVPLMIEHMANAAEFDRSRKHLMTVASEIGLRFE